MSENTGIEFRDIMPSDAKTDLIEQPPREQKSKPLLRRWFHGSDPDDPTIPNNINGYPVGEVIGSGGEGKVHKTKYGITRREAAVKVRTNEKTPDTTGITLERSFGQDGEPTVRVIPPTPAMSEGEILQQAGDWGRNRNIIGVRATGRNPKHRLGERGGEYVVTELVKEGSLADLLVDKGAFSMREAIGITEQVADAIESTQESGFVHADVKPGNVLVKSTKGRIPDVALADFGMAGPPRSLKEEKFTEAYAAPEQFERRISYATDVYSLGLLLYELQTGEKFYNFHKDENGLFARIGFNTNQEKYDSYVHSRLHKLTSVSPESVSLLENMLQLNEFDRPDIKSVKQSLKALGKQYSKSDITLESAVPTTSFTNVSRRVLAKV